MQRLSTRSAKRQKVIHARSTLTEVYLTTLCLLITLLRLKFLTQHILLTYFSKPVEANMLTHYILLTNFSKQLLTVRFLTHYILLTFFSTLLRLIF